MINDGTFFEPLQVVYHDELENFAEIEKLNVGAAVIVTGNLVPTPEAKQPFEIQAKEVMVEYPSADGYLFLKVVFFFAVQIFNIYQIHNPSPLFLLFLRLLVLCGIHFGIIGHLDTIKKQLQRLVADIGISHIRFSVLFYQRFFTLIAIICKQFNVSLEYSGMEMKDYLASTNSTQEEFDEQVKQTVEDSLKNQLIMEAIYS